MSEIGPTTIWPNPVDRKNNSRLICRAGVLAPRSEPIDGSAGRYMSMANGPMADNRPRTTAVRRNLRVMTGSFGSAAAGGERSQVDKQARVQLIRSALTHLLGPDF